MIGADHAIFNDKRVSPTDRMVAVSILLLADNHGWCWASKPAIARVAGMHRNNVKRHLKKLADRGLLEAQKNPADCRQTGYKITDHAVTALHTLSDHAVTALHNSEKRPDHAVTALHTLPESTPAMQSQRCITHVPTTTQKIRYKDKEKEKEKEKEKPPAPAQADLLDPAPKKPPKKPARRCTKNPPKPITEDWWPGEATIANLVSVRQIPEPFVMAEIIEFIIYWRERGDSRAGWDATFCNHVKKVWKWSLNNEKRQKFTDATGRPISEYEQVWRDNAREAWEAGDNSFEVGASVHIDADGKRTIK